MQIGLIGGIGPSATIAYYQRLVARFAEEGRKLELTIVQADVGTLIENSLGDQRAEQAEIFADLIGRLKAAGADFAAITSLGGHFCFAETQAISPLPLLSAIAPLDRHFSDAGIRTIGLLGTETVMRTRLYGQLAETQSVVPPGRLSDLGDLYLDMARTASCSPEARLRFFEAGHEMVRDQGADAVLLAGTDLGLAFDGQDPGFDVIDALDIHVDAMVQAVAEGRIT